MSIKERVDKATRGPWTSRATIIAAKVCDHIFWCSWWLIFWAYLFYYMAQFLER